MKISLARFSLGALVIVSTAAYLQARNRGEIFPSRLPLKSFPGQIGPWSGGPDLELPPDQLKVLGHPEYLLRNYSDAQKVRPGINLFIAYYRTQSNGETPHSPQNCLPGSGWTPMENTRVLLTMPGHEPFPANRYIIAQGDARQIVLYWFWAHDRGVASEVWNKYYLVRDSIRMSRSDGSLVRITSPMLPGETPVEAQQRISPFVNEVLPMQNDFIPR